MKIVGPRPQKISHRLRRRLRQRYLRWLAMQPVGSICLSEGWRTFWRSCRRRANAFFRSRLVINSALCLAACGFLLVFAIAVIFVACAVRFLPALFFSAPENLSFADPTQRAAVALTRLTVFQSAFLPLLFLWASCCFRNASSLEARSCYKKYSSLSLVGYRIGFFCFLACSVAVAVGATLGHGANCYAAAASLTVMGCVSWLAWTVGKRLMAVRWPPRMSPAAPAAVACIFLILLYAAVVGLCYGSGVLSISQYLKWLGPLGWVNGLLHGLSHGQTQNLLPLGTFCAVAAYTGYRLDGSTKSWAFRRRLLSIYRSQGPCPHQTTTTTGEQQVARDLRQALSGNGWPSWRSILYPRWMKGHVTFLFLLVGALFALQLVLAGLVLFLEAVESEAGPGQILNEKLMMYALLSSVCGWAVLLLEGFAACRNQANLLEFSRRPVSPGETWRWVQLDGLRLVPTQVFYAIPFVALAIGLAPEYAMHNCIAVGAALWGCVALRTTLVAGSCYFASIVTLRTWMVASLQTLGVLVGWCLLVGIAGNALVVGTKPDLTPGALAVYLLVQQIATFTALGIACGSWYAVGRSAWCREDRTNSA